MLCEALDLVFSSIQMLSLNMHMVPSQTSFLGLSAAFTLMPVQGPPPPVTSASPNLDLFFNLLFSFIAFEWHCDLLISLAYYVLFLSGIITFKAGRISTWFVCCVLTGKCPDKPDFRYIFE